MQTYGPILAGLIFIAIGLYCFYLAANRRKVKALADQVQRVSIGNVKPGLTEIRGHIVAEASLEAPFSKRACVAFRFSTRKYEHRPHGESGRQWRDLSSGQKAVPFRLKDNFGEIRIEPDGAEFTWPKGRTFRSRSGKRTSVADRMKKLKEADRRQQAASGKKGGFIRKIEYDYPLDVPGDLMETTGEESQAGRIHYTDSCFTEGDEVTIIGPATRNPSGNPPYEITLNKTQPVFLISGQESPSVRAQLSRSIRNATLAGLGLICLGILIIAVM